MALSSTQSFRRMSAALMFSTSLTFASVALSAQASAQTTDESIRAFEESAYTYCDAKLIAHFIGEPVEGGKVRIGSKLVRGQFEILQSTLARARQYSTCSWADTQHSYGDAEALAQVWGLASASDAKDKVAVLYTQGRSAEVLSALQQAGDVPLTAEQEQGAAAFYQSDYTYCDAKLVSAAWDINIDQAKAEIGIKILNGYSDNLQQVFAAGRQETQCDFPDTQLSYEDAEKLASIWGVAVEEAKVTAAQYYTNGQSAAVRAALASEAPPRPTPIIKTPPGQQDEPPPANTGK